MIIWIASYPKSGNTWLRAFLCSYFYMDLEKENFNFDKLSKITLFPRIENFEDIGVTPKTFEEVTKAWIPAQNKINSNNKVNFLKTHNGFGSLNNCNFTDRKNTLGAIYLVRDPRDVLMSLSKHLNKNISECLKIILHKNHMGVLQGTKNVFGEMRGNWAQNYNSWKNFNIREKIIIKYEDIIENPFYNFSKIINFINKLFKVEINEEKIKKCIEICKFQNLQNLEKKIGFVENLEKNELFFNKGQIKKWQNKIDKKILYEIEKNFGKEMKELGYLT